LAEGLSERERDHVAILSLLIDGKAPAVLQAVRRHAQPGRWMR
jgi:hypothetical protein